MPRHLGDRQIQQICSLIDGWRGALTWEALVASVEPILGHRYSRQTLCHHPEIKTAYDAHKARRGQQTRPTEAMSPEKVAISDRITRLEAENAHLRLENDRLLHQFAVWSYNAALAKIGPDQLNRPLPKTNRDRTKPRA